MSASSSVSLLLVSSVLTDSITTSLKAAREKRVRARIDCTDKLQAARRSLKHQ